MVKGKKAYIRTLEAVIAIFIAFFFLTYIIPAQNVNTARFENLRIMDTLKENENFRNCVIILNTTCINATIRQNLENRFDFTFNISEDPAVNIEISDKERIFSEGIMIAGNSTSYSPKILRVFYWPKQPK